MSAHWVIDIMAAAQPKPHPTGIPYLTIFGIVGTVIGIIAAVQQFTSSIRRRAFQGAEEEFMNYMASNKEISESLSQVKQYERMKATLRNEIETQIPRQARMAYLNNRLEQLKDDLHRSYHEFESVRKELGRGQATSELDQSIRDAVTASIPQRRIQERRTLYVLMLVVLLLAFNVLPFGFGPGGYFDAVGDSLYQSVAGLIIKMLVAALCLLPIWLLCITFISNNNSVLLRFQRLHRILKIALLGSPGAVSAVAVAIGFILWDRALYEHFVQGRLVDDLLNYIEAAFNTAVVAFSIWIAVLLSLRRGSTTR